ncbi:MAG: NUDIX domain-containing protein [Pseudomonadota bacterium]
MKRPSAGCGAAIENEAGELLLIQRLKSPESGHWGLPGGKIDFGEAVETAIVREIKEELGVDIEVTGLACLTETIGADDGAHWVAPVYHAVIIDGDPEIKEPEKHGGWGWFAQDRMPSPLTTPTQQYLSSRNGDGLTRGEG